MARKVERESVPLSRFGVLVAQLESIVASARQQPPDALLCFDLLSDLVSVIEDEPKDSIIQWQRKCEDALYSLLVLGARRPVRRLASVAMGRIIAKGDGISIYSRASSLQGWLVDGKRSESLSSAGVAQCLGELYRLFGRRITSGLVETTSIAAKLMKFHEDFVRQEALQMLQNALEGSGGTGASAAYSEAFRIIMRVGVADKSFIVRVTAARCLKTFASIGGPGLGVPELENSASYCVKALEDPISLVRDSFAEALGALLALGMNPEAQVQPRGKSHHTPRKLEAGLQKYLTLPFTRSSGARLKNLRIGLSLSWVFFLQAMRLKYLLQDTELQNFALQAMEMLHGDSSVDAHSLACVVYILRVGVTDQMTEPTQRSFLVLLGRQLESPETRPSMKVAVLRILCYLLATLGEVPPEFKDVLDDTVVAALSHSSLLVRLEAALTLRVLAEVDPTCVGGLISYGVTTLHALRESAAIEKGDRLKLELDSLHGQAVVLAALVSISPRLRLGYPARLPKSVLEVSKKMLVGFSRNPTTAIIEKEAGWLLLASLITSMPKEELEDQVFDILSLWAAPFGGNPERRIKQAEDLTSEIRVWSAAVEALTAFIRSFVSSSVTTINGGILLHPVLVYLSGALSYISSVAAKQLQNLKSSMDLFIIRTLIAYQSLPDPMAYKSDHPQIIKICTTPFRDPSGCEESSCLRSLLDKRDACLGPWIPGRDWFEDELRAFEGGKDGIMPCVWETEISSFPQPESIGKMVVNQMLMCFGTIFAIQDASEKLLLLGMIDQSLKAGKKQLWHVSNTTNACVGLLAGLKALLALRPQALEVEILSPAQAIFQGILAEGEICAAQRRASAEGLGLIARLGNDVFTARMTRSLLGDLVGTTDSSYTGSIALALGCIHRSAGGMALSTLVPSTVSSLSLLAKSSNADLQAWSLHGLLLTIEAAGLSYVSQVQATLFLAIEILLSEENGWVNIRQGIGRLINAIVAVLGPELSPGSSFFSRCKSVVAEISSGQETSTLLECIRFTQQLVLFAPQAVSVHSHVQILLSTLSSRQPTLRHLAVSTLRHLIEKDPVSIIDEKIEVNLFEMLDEETDSEIVNLVRSTIIRLLYASCPSCSSRWIALCHNMVIETSTRRNVVENRTRSKRDLASTTSNDDRTYYGEDDEDMITSSSDGQMHDSTIDGSIIQPKREKHLRYRTRVFAAECLSYLPAAVGTDLAHFDLYLARETTGDWLVLHLQELVALAYQISTGQFDNMQTIGVGLLVTIMDKFGNLPDPELPGHLMMEQYQAQLVSAVRTALVTSSGPLLLDAGLQLATKVLTSSITSGDPVALQRLFSLISRPLDDFKDLYYPSFAEWVACKIKIRLLAAHASVKCYAYALLRDNHNNLPDEYLSLIPMFSKSSSILGKHWISILDDYTHILFGLQCSISYKPFLDGIQSSLVSSKVQSCLDEVWPVVLQAIALDAVPAKFEMDDDCKSSSKIVSESIFTSGYSMVRLELREFHFLWGFSLLVLFQGQQLVAGKQVIPIPGPGKIKSSGNSTEKDPNILSPKLNEIALLVFQFLTTERFFSQEFLTLDLCRELLQVCMYPNQITGSWFRLVIPVLFQIVKGCPDDYFQSDDFTFVAMELCVKYHYYAFQSTDIVGQDERSFKELISALFITAETIVHRLIPEKQWKLLMAFLSTSYKCLKGASTDSCLSIVISFARNTLPSLKKHLRDKIDLREDTTTHMEAVLGAWQNEILHLCQDCIKNVHIPDNKSSRSCKLLLAKLSFCLEEAISLARLCYETQQLGLHKDNSMFLFTLYRKCITCLQIAFLDPNIQVQTIGLYVLKSIFQRELGETANTGNHSFILFTAGELLGDIFSLIHNIVKETVARESFVIAGECLRLLVLMHSLSQGSECQKDVMNLLLEAIIMVLSVSTEVHSQELTEIKNNAMRLVSHLAQIPSSAVQFREVLLAMPTTRRQQLQDIIRASVIQGQNPAPMPFASSSPSPIIRLPVQTGKAPQANVPEPGTACLNEDNVEKGEEDDDDDDDDWDAFQSFPADNATTARPEPEETEALPSDDSSILNSDHCVKINLGESSDFEHHVDDMDVSDAQDPGGFQENALARQGDGNGLQEFSDSQPPENTEFPSATSSCATSRSLLITSNDDRNEEFYDPQPVEDAEAKDLYRDHHSQVHGQAEATIRSRAGESDLQESSNTQLIEDAQESRNGTRVESGEQTMVGMQSDENNNQHVSDPEPAEVVEDTSDRQQLLSDTRETTVSQMLCDVQPLQDASMAGNKIGGEETSNQKPVEDADTVIGERLQCDQVETILGKEGSNGFQEIPDNTSPLDSVEKGFDEEANK